MMKRNDVDALIAQMNATYAQIDAELRLYSEKANSNDRNVASQANGHRVEADRLTVKAREITSQLMNAAHGR